MRTLTAAVDEKYIEALDTVIRSTGMYSSRSEFIKDAVRCRIAELMRFEGTLETVKKAAHKAKNKYRYNGELTPTKKDVLAKKYR